MPATIFIQGHVVMANRTSQLAKQGIFLVAVLGVAFIGVRLGMGSRERIEPPIVGGDMPETDLKTGVAFPDVSLIAADGSTVSVHALLRERGGIVLFMEMTCPPCKQFAAQLNEIVQSGSDISIIGITPDSPADVSRYSSEQDILFPVFSDTAYTYMSEHRVQNFPLLLLVDRNGIIRRSTFDARERIDPDAVASLIKRRE